MSRVLTKCLLFLSLSFQVMLSFGMQDYQHGTLCPKDQRSALLTEVVRSSFQVQASNGTQFLDAAFKKFDQKHPISWEQVNLLFHNGALYINRFFPIHQAYEGISIAGREYNSLQVANVLGIDKDRIIALQKIKENFGIMKQAASKNYFSIGEAWSAIRGEEIEIRKTVIDERLSQCAQFANTQWLRSYYVSLFNFSCAASVLDYDIAASDFTVGTLEAIYAHAQEVCREYANLISDYISSFHPEDGEAFRQSLEGGDILLRMQPACANYGKYAHTEYILNYHLLDVAPDIESIEFVSYYDMCSNCERLWAKIAGDVTVRVASFLEYDKSRQVNRADGTPNLILIYK